MRRAAGYIVVYLNRIVDLFSICRGRLFVMPITYSTRASKSGLQYEIPWGIQSCFSPPTCHEPGSIRDISRIVTDNRFTFDFLNSSRYRCCFEHLSENASFFFLRKLLYFFFVIKPVFYLYSIFWFAWQVKMNASRDTMRPVTAFSVRADTYSQCSSRSLVSETSFSGAIRDPGRKRESIDLERSIRLVLRLSSRFDGDPREDLRGELPFYSSRCITYFCSSKFSVV